MRRRYMKVNGRNTSYINDYLTIEALEDDLSVSFSKDVEFSVNGIRWVMLRANTSSPSISKGQTISFRANLIPTEYIGVGTFSINKKCNLLGNVLSLIGGNNLSDYCFYSLFKYCTTIKSVSKNFLPFTKLAVGCYQYMFKGCTSLTTAPDLPATTLSWKCYEQMFCDCTNLNYIKAMFTTKPSSDYTYGWLSGVASTGTFVKNPDATWDVVGANGVPKGWTVKFDGEEDGGG